MRIETNFISLSHYACKADHTTLGAYGERIMLLWLTLLGFNVSYTGDQQGYDILLNGNIRLEIKSARKNKRKNYWQFCLTKRDHCNISNSDVVMLLLIGKFGRVDVYMIPSDLLAGQKQIKLSANSSKWIEYRIVNSGATE